MEQLLEFLDRYTFDRQFYWLLPAADQIRQIELRWQKDEKIRWSYRVKGDLFWRLVRNDDLTQTLEREGLSMAAFEERLRTAVLEQVVFAEFMMKEARTIFGEETIQQALTEHEVFMIQVRDTISRLMQEKSKPADPVAKTSSPAIGNNHLRLV